MFTSEQYENFINIGIVVDIERRKLNRNRLTENINMLLEITFTIFWHGRRNFSNTIFISFFSRKKLIQFNLIDTLYFSHIAV